MKKLQNAIIVLTLVLLTSCGGGAGKFEGKWKEPEAQNFIGKTIMVIKKSGDKYEMYPEDKPDKFMSFSYDKERDMLTSMDLGQPMDIKYDSKSKHLVIAPRGNAGFGPSSIELESVK